VHSDSAQDLRSTHTVVALLDDTVEDVIPGSGTRMFVLGRTTPVYASAGDTLASRDRMSTPENW
jgi:hypothetical protein